MKAILAYLLPHLDLIKFLSAIALLVTVAGGLLQYHHYVFRQGEQQEKARRDKIDVANTAKAQKELKAENRKTELAQAELSKTLADLESKETELRHEQGISKTLQSDLLAGRERYRVLVTRSSQRDTTSAANSACGTSAGVDSRAEVIEDLAPRVGKWIERLRANENAAIDRLDACIKAYDAVSTALENH